MAMSGMITFVLLVALIDYLNGQNIPKHPERVMIKISSRTARIRCIVDSSTLQSNALHWYRAQSGGAFQRLMYFEAGSTKAINDQGVSTGSYIGSVRNLDENSVQVSLTVSKPTPQDAGSYYCALWTDNKKVFGSGTRLYVTDQGKDKVISPTLLAYLPSRKTSDKQAMVCQASGMFPDLVTFTWKKKSNTGDWTDVSNENFVEQSNSENSKVTSVTSMMIVDKNMIEDNIYKCTVNHEGGTSISLDLKEDSKNQAKKSNEPAPTCSPNTVETFKKQISGNSEQMPSLYLFVYAYVIMLLKNVIYFCAVSIFLFKFGKKE